MLSKSVLNSVRALLRPKIFAEENVVVEFCHDLKNELRKRFHNDVKYKLESRVDLAWILLTCFVFPAFRIYSKAVKMHLQKRLIKSTNR